MSASHVIGALFYLRVMSLRNAVIARFARLKQPKYLVGAIVGVGYFYWLFFGRGMFGRAPRAAGFAEVLPLERMPTVVAIVALPVTILAAFYWLWPRSRAALTFSEAEIAFLFPAPIGRKTLIHFRWINAQLRILFTSLLLAMFSASWSFVPGNAAVRLVGFWLLLSTLDLHAVGSSFALTRLLDRGMTSLRRSGLTIAIAAAAIGAALLASWRGLRPPEPGTLADPSAVFDYVGSVLTTEPLAWLLAPARWAVQPLLSYDFRSFVVALGPALLLYAAHYVWVLRSEVSFEEASVAKAEKRAAWRETILREGTVRFGRERKARPGPFKLDGVGRPEVAFLWKNLLASASYLQRPRIAVIAAAVIVIGSLWLRTLGIPPLPVVVGVMSLMCAAYTLVFGPMIARQDLRHDLPNADILKTYPLPGWQIVLGEVLAPIVVITALVWLQLLAAALNFQMPRGAALPAGTRTAVALGLAALVPFLTAIMVLVMNAAVLLFPAWVPQGAARARGIDVMGQRLFFVAGLFLTMTASLLPAAIVAAAVFFMTFWLIGPIGAGALGVLAALIALGAEIALVISLLGKRFERFDLSAELKP
jgi:ABC-2 type transport system permease protein